MRPLLVLFILLATLPGARASERETVELLSSEGMSTAATVAVTARLRNALPVSISELRLRLRIRSAKGTFTQLVEIGETLAAGEMRAIRVEGRLPPDVFKDDVTTYDVELLDYRLEANAEALLLLVGEASQSDLVSAAGAIGLDATQLDASARRTLARGVPGLVEALEAAATRAPGEVEPLSEVMRVLFSIRALGVLGGAGSLPTIVKSLETTEPVFESFRLFALTRPFAWLQLVAGPDLDLASTVGEAARAAAPEEALAALLLARRGAPAVVEAACWRAISSQWPTAKAQAQALTGPERAAAIESLSAALDEESVSLLLWLATSDPAVRARIESLAPGAWTPVLVRLLRDSSDAATVLARGVLAKDPAAAARLEDVLTERGLAAPAGSPVEVLAELVAKALTQQDDELVHRASTFDEADLDALAALDLARSVARTPAQRRQLLEGYLSWSERQLSGLGRTRRLLGAVLRRIVAYRGEENLEARLVALATQIAEKSPAEEKPGLLGALESSLGNAGRQELASIYERLAAEVSGRAREGLLASAARVNPTPGKAAAKGEAIGVEAAGQGGGLWWGLVVVVALGGLGGLWRVASRGRAAFVEGRCESCEREAPLQAVSLRYNVGLVVTRREGRRAGELCRRCVCGVGAKFVVIGLFVGWWGLVSFFVNVAYLAGNVLAIARVWRVPDECVGRREAGAAGD